MDSEETLPALLDERAEMNCTVPGITPDGGPLEGTPVLESLEHSVLEKPLDGGSMEGRSVVDWFVRLIMELLQHSVLATAAVWEPLEHSRSCD